MTKENSVSVEDTWNSIAKSFDITRRKPWQQCLDFIDSLPRNCVIADIGCGNGRHLFPAAKHCKKVIGVDISSELLKIVEDKIYENKIGNVVLFHSDATDLPLKDGSVDAVLFIASLHNIRGRENRIEALCEIRRILKEDGKAMVSVWSRWQDKYRKMFFKKWFTSIGRNEFGDIDIFWRQHGLNIPRFYHLYSKREFENDIYESGLRIFEIRSEKIVSRRYPDNFFAIVHR